MKAPLDPNEIYGSITDDYLAMLDHLSKDIHLATKQIEINDCQTWRRMYVRCVCSTIEAVLAYMKTFVRLDQKFDHLCLSQEDQKRLDEFDHIVHRDGRLKKRYYHLPLLRNVVFTLELYAYSSCVFMKIDKYSEGWSALSIMAAARNRITHPKTFQDVSVSDFEIEQSIRAFKWFTKTVLDIQKACERSLSKQIEGLEQARSKADRPPDILPSADAPTF